MHVTTANLVRGDVVVRSGFRGVVWTVDGDTLIVLPVQVTDGPLHRGDVVPADWCDADAQVLGHEARVRTSCMLTTGARGQVKLGRVSDAMLESLKRTMSRTAASGVFESKWRADTARRIAEGR